MKLGLLVICIALGSLALRHTRGARLPAWCFAAALAMCAAMFGMARAHHPLGSWAG